MRLDRRRVHRSRVKVTCLKQQVLRQRSQRRVRVLQMFLRLYRREPGLDLQLSRQELIKQVIHLLPIPRQMLVAKNAARLSHLTLCTASSHLRSDILSRGA